jgi:hypothetical protein
MYGRLTGPDLELPCEMETAYVAQARQRIKRYGFIQMGIEVLIQMT